MFRILMVAAAAVGGGIAIGRKALDREIERRVGAAVELAQANAAAELDMRIRDVIRRTLTSLGATLAIKAGMIAGAYALYAAGELTSTGFRIVTAVLIAAFLARDFARTAPYLAPAVRYARQAGWNPRRALKSFVVGVIFEKAYAEAVQATSHAPHRFWIGLSNHCEEAISQDVARRVSEVAVETTFERTRTIVIIAVLKAAAMWAAYAAFAALAFVSI